MLIIYTVGRCLNHYHIKIFNGIIVKIIMILFIIIKMINKLVLLLNVILNILKIFIINIIAIHYVQLNNQLNMINYHHSKKNN